MYNDLMSSFSYDMWVDGGTYKKISYGKELRENKGKKGKQILLNKTHLVIELKWL